MSTGISLLELMHLHVALQAVLSFELCLTIMDVAKVEFIHF